MTAADGNGDDSNVVGFPQTPEERRAMRKLQQDRERQRLVNVFVDGDKALFRDSNGDVFADLIVDGHRETWPIRSMEFRGAYIAYLQRQLDRLVGEGSILAVGVKHAMSKNAINNVLNEYEIKANSSLATRRDVYARIAPHDCATRTGRPSASPPEDGASSRARRCAFDGPAACCRCPTPSEAGRSRRCGRSST